MIFLWSDKHCQHFMQLQELEVILTVPSKTDYKVKYQTPLPESR